MLNLFQMGKDSFIVSAAKSFFQEQFARYGELQDLDLDSTSKQVRFVILPIGETRAVEVRLLDYRIEREKNATFFVPGRVKIDRPWLQALYDDLAQGQRFEVPPSVAGLI